MNTATIANVRCTARWIVMGIVAIPAVYRWKSAIAASQREMNIPCAPVSLR